MTGLLLWKEHLKGFYQKYNQLLHPLIRFLFILCMVLSINSSIGYMVKLKNPIVVFMVCLVGALLPNCVLVFLIGGFLVAHLYAVSLEMALIAVLVMIVVGILYYGFKPGDSWLMVFTPLAFLFKIPYAVPLPCICTSQSFKRRSGAADPQGPVISQRFGISERGYK